MEPSTKRYTTTSVIVDGVASAAKQQQRPSPMRVKYIPVNTIPEGFRIRRKFNDGKFYVARVMSEMKWEYDVDKQMNILTRQVKYYADNQEEWLDGDQLNKWAYEDTKEDEGDEDDNEEDECDKNAVDKSTKQSKHAAASCDKSTGNAATVTVTTAASACSGDGGDDDDNDDDYDDDDDDDDVVRRSKRNKVCSAAVGVVTMTKIEARNVLKFKMGITEKEIDSVLDQMSSPFNVNEAILLIHEERKIKYDNMSNNGGIIEEKVDDTIFKPKIGMKVRIGMAGSNYHGKVINGPKLMKSEGGKYIQMWTVKFDDDGTKEDYDWNELCRFRASRPIINFNQCRRRGRNLCCLELFCGRGIITQEFCERKWKVKSIDSDPKSYATNVIDIMKATYKDIGYVPDFIWASPPCQTCSNLAGKAHGNAKMGEFENTQEAHEHNYLLTQMMYIIKWAKAKNPHLIVVIEDPTGQMSKIPLMIEFMRSFNLYQSTIDYCTFDRYDKKTTYLWTNDFHLHSRLNEFRCSKEKCYYVDRFHPIVSSFKTAAIPQKLAEEVAEYVHSKFYTDRIPKTLEVCLTKEEEKEFDVCMSTGQIN